MLRADNGSGMLALWRNNSQTARIRHVEIALLINLHPVGRIFAFGRCHIEEDFSIR
jgi:hypothetical protein